MRRKVSILGLLLLGLAHPALAQLPSPQSPQPRGHYLRVPRVAAAPRAVAPPPVEYVPAAPRQRILVESAPRDVVPMAWRVAGTRTPFCGRHKVALGRWLIRKGSPRPVLELQEEPLTEETVRVVYEQPVAATPQAPAEDLVYVPDEEPVFAQRAVPPPKSPPVPMPRAVAPPKARPRAVAPRKAAPRAVPSPQAGGDEAPPPPAADGVGEPTETAPAEPEDG
jgi:hypothetical protein